MRDIAIVIIAWALLALALLVAKANSGPRCVHALEPDVDEETGRIFLSCHCGERFER